MIIGRRSDLPDPWKPHDTGQPAIPWHLRPKHHKRRDPRCQRALMQHIKPPGCGIGIEAPGLPRVRVQIVKPDRQCVVVRIACVVLYLEVTDRAAGVEKNGRSGAVFHDREIGLPGVKSNRTKLA